MTQALILGVLAGMPLAAIELMAMLIYQSWKTPRGRPRTITNFKKFESRRVDLLTIAVFGMVTKVSQALAYRFAGHAGETLSEATERWWHVTNNALGLLMAACIAPLAFFLGKRFPIIYGIGMDIPCAVVTFILWRTKKRFYTIPHLRKEVGSK